MCFRSFEYKNEAGGDPPDKPANAPDPNGDPKSYSIPVYSTHQLVIGTVSFYMEEFRIGTGRGIGDSMYNKHVESSPVAEQFYSTMSELPDIQYGTTAAAAHALGEDVSSCSDDDNDNASEMSDINRTAALQIASLTGKTDIKITVKVVCKAVELAPFISTNLTKLVCMSVVQFTANGVGARAKSAIGTTTWRDEHIFNA